jgi:hypothetical protein
MGLNQIDHHFIRRNEAFFNLEDHLIELSHRSTELNDGLNEKDDHLFFFVTRFKKKMTIFSIFCYRKNATWSFSRSFDSENEMDDGIFLQLTHKIEYMIMKFYC